MRCRQRGEFLRAVVVDDDLLPVPLLEGLLALLGGGEVGEAGLALLQPLPVEPVAAVDVDGAPDVVDVVGDEGPTVEDDGVAAVLALLQPLGEALAGDGPRLLQQEGALQGRALAAGRRGQADGAWLQVQRGDQTRVAGLN